MSGRVELVEEPVEWGVWSCARGTWLRQDALGWAADGEPGGRWSLAVASEHAANLPNEDGAAAIPKDGPV